jgi:ubiquinone/menaquinone biosynthesis C-methylase UbiE
MASATFWRCAVELTDIIRCPQTGGRLRLDHGVETAFVENSSVVYPIIEGIIDFCPESQDRIAASYDKVAARYDSHQVSSPLGTKMIGLLVWGRASDRDSMEEVLSLLPDSFHGVLLDVPVGTGVFTASLYRRYPDATIIGVDCSLNMLRKAQARFREQGIPHVHLLKADAAHLPVRDAAVDLVLSMNGWHAFADKQRTIAEMRRVLRREGTLIACGYVRGARWLSDWFVRHFGVRGGYFTPPFFAADDLARQFQDFTITRQRSDKSIAWFEAIKQ